MAETNVQKTLNSENICLDNSNDKENNILKPSHPFLKWAGGKRCLITELLAHLPPEFNDYFEPFVGGGALFFALHEQIRTAYLSDANFDLIMTYRAIQKDPYQLMEILSKHEKNHSHDYYYKIRKQHQLKNMYDIAARLIYLNKTCYNGLYRVNKSGKFNVPIGQYNNPTIFQKSNILACNRALQKAKINYLQFDKINPNEGDFVYFDPPYHPTDDISFTSYTDLDFTEQDQRNLRDFALNLAKKGVNVMISNSYTNFIRDAYNVKPFHIYEVNAPRFVNCKKDRRYPIKEILITSY